MNINDARVRYTRHIIEETFLDLLREKPLSRITATELCRKADINRATFYKHYLDIPDLVEKLEEQLVERVLPVFDGAVDMEDFLTELLEFLRGEGRRYMALASENADPSFPSRIFQRCFERAYPAFEKNLPEHRGRRERLVYDFIAYGSGAVLRLWARDGMAEKPKDVAELILRLCRGAIGGI